MKTPKFVVYGYPTVVVMRSADLVARFSGPK